MSNLSELETRVWWLKTPFSLEVLQRELESCRNALEISREYVRNRLENEEELFGIIPYERQLESKIDCLKWDIEHWPRPI